MARIRFTRRATRALAGLGLLLVWGCGDDGLPRRYPVYGEVTYNGKPLTQGIVNFIPQSDKGRAASGTIQEGSYNMTTLTPGDGVIPGPYRVTVTAVKRTEESKKILARTPDAPPGHDQPYFGPPSGPQIFKANKLAKRLVPDKYNSPDRSGLTAEVKEESNRLDFKLTD
jgi:hypothetical protein